MTKATIERALARDIVLGDGGYLLELERRGYVQAGPYTPEAVLEHPQAVLQLHREFLRCGAQVLQALTFYGSGPKLALVGREDGEVERLNRVAVSLAREVAGDQALVAGCITQVPGFIAGDRRTHPLVRSQLVRQVAAQAAAGADFIIGEMYFYLEEALLALQVIRDSGLPAMITLSSGPAGSADGIPPAECARRLHAEGASVVGVNCSFGPSVSLGIAVQMRTATDLPIACQPVAYHTPAADFPMAKSPGFPLALERSQLSRFDMAEFARRAREEGIRYLGGCCGTAPYHIRAMAEALGRQTEASEKSPDLSRHIMPAIRDKCKTDYWKSLA